VNSSVCTCSCECSKPPSRSEFYGDSQSDSQIATLTTRTLSMTLTIDAAACYVLYVPRSNLSIYAKPLPLPVSPEVDVKPSTQESCQVPPTPIFAPLPPVVLSAPPPLRLAHSDYPVLIHAPLRPCGHVPHQDPTPSSLVPISTQCSASCCGISAACATVLTKWCGTYS